MTAPSGGAFRPATGKVITYQAVRLTEATSFHPFRIVPFHEALVLTVGEDSALAPHGFGHEKPAHAARPDHSGGVELDKPRILRMNYAKRDLNADTPNVTLSPVEG